MFHTCVPSAHMLCLSVIQCPTPPLAHQNLPRTALVSQSHSIGNEHCLWRYSDHGLPATPPPLTLTLMTLQGGDEFKPGGFKLEHTNLTTIVSNEGILVGGVKSEISVKEIKSLLFGQVKMGILHHMFYTQHTASLELS